MVKSSPSWTDYRERLERVTAYIYDHLDEDIDLNRLAEVACLSPHHWHRIYRAIYGETIAATVKRLRLHRAAGYLVRTSMGIEAIAEKSGYPNLQSFTRIFKSVYGMPPAQYRRTGSHMRFELHEDERTGIMYDVTIKTVPTLQAITLEHRGDYMEIGRAFDRLFAWVGQHDLDGTCIRSFGVYYDDPEAVPAAQLRSRAGVVLGKPVPVEPPFEYLEIAGGTCAVLRYQGPYAEMLPAYRWLYGEWLPQSGREAADAPCFEEYLNNPCDTAPTDLTTNIHLPLIASVAEFAGDASGVSDSVTA